MMNELKKLCGERLDDPDPMLWIPVPSEDKQMWRDWLRLLTGAGHFKFVGFAAFSQSYWYVTSVAKAERWGDAVVAKQEDGTIALRPINCKAFVLQSVNYVPSHNPPLKPREELDRDQQNLGRV